jgi:hypothetical protein
MIVHEYTNTEGKEGLYLTRATSLPTQEFGRHVFYSVPIFAHATCHAIFFLFSRSFSPPYHALSRSL